MKAVMIAAKRPGRNREDSSPVGIEVDWLNRAIENRGRLIRRARSTRDA